MLLEYFGIKTFIMIYQSCTLVCSSITNIVCCAWNAKVTFKLVVLCDLERQGHHCTIAIQTCPWFAYMQTLFFVSLWFFWSNTSFDIMQDWPLLFGITSSVTHTGANVIPAKQSLVPSGRIPWWADLLHVPGESRRQKGCGGGDSVTREWRRTVWEMLLRRLCRVTRVTSCHCSLSSVGNSTI